MEDSKIVVLMCGGKRCCPSIEIKNDGSAIIHDTDDGRDQHITLSKDQVTKLIESLKEND